MSHDHPLQLALRSHKLAQATAEDAVVFWRYVPVFIVIKFMHHVCSHVYLLLCYGDILWCFSFCIRCLPCKSMPTFPKARQLPNKHQRKQLIRSTEFIDGAIINK